MNQSKITKLQDLEQRSFVSLDEVQDTLVDEIGVKRAQISLRMHTPTPAHSNGGIPYQTVFLEGSDNPLAFQTTGIAPEGLKHRKIYMLNREWLRAIFEKDQNS